MYAAFSVMRGLRIISPACFMILAGFLAERFKCGRRVGDDEILLAQDRDRVEVARLHDLDVAEVAEALHRALVSRGDGDERGILAALKAREVLAHRAQNALGGLGFGRLNRERVE